MGTMKIFVAHNSKLPLRKKHIIAQFKKHNITNYEWVELFDKDEVHRYVTHTTLGKPKISLLLKHFFIYHQIAQKYDYALILEDDVILSDNFLKKLAHYQTQLPVDFDFLFIGNGCNLHIEDKKILPNVNIYLKGSKPNWRNGTRGDGATRCTDSYLVHKNCAVQLCNYIKTSRVNLPIDLWLNQAAQDMNLKSYWAEPTIVTQGSQNGMFAWSL